MPFTYRYPHPAVTTDIVIFTIRQDELKILLIKRALPPHRNQWALPGGFIKLEESLEEGAKRELQEETGVTGVYLEQLYTFGRPDRDPRERVITVAYYALIPCDQLPLAAGDDAIDLRLQSAVGLPAPPQPHHKQKHDQPGKGQRQALEVIIAPRLRFALLVGGEPSPTRHRHVLQSNPHFSGNRLKKVSSWRVLPEPWTSGPRKRKTVHEPQHRDQSRL